MKMMVRIFVTNQNDSSKRSIGLVDRLVIFSSTLWFGFGWMPGTIAQPNRSSNMPEICDVNFGILKSDELTNRANRANIVTADTVSAKEMTLPSLWWTNEQAPAKLVTNWIANRQQKQIYLLVNAQYWDLLDYIDRYHTIDRFGRVAQGYGYNLKLCSSQKIVLARYSCEEIADLPGELTMNRASCQLWLNATGQDGLGVKNK